MISELFFYDLHYGGDLHYRLRSILRFENPSNFLQNIFERQILSNDKSFNVHKIPSNSFTNKTEVDLFLYFKFYLTKTVPTFFLFAFPERRSKSRRLSRKMTIFVSENKNRSLKNEFDFNFKIIVYDRRRIFDNKHFCLNQQVIKNKLITR